MCNCSSCCCNTGEELRINIVSDIIKKMQENKERHLAEAALILIELISNKSKYNKISQKRIDILTKDVVKCRKRLSERLGRSARHSY